MNKQPLLLCTLAFVSGWTAPAWSQEIVIPDPELEAAPPWSAAIDAYGGFGVLGTASGLQSHALGGTLMRMRYRNFQLGGFVEAASFASSRATHVGGTVGVFLPYRYFVDLEGWVGLGMRKYVDDRLRFGPGGSEVKTPALSFRIGISDRAGGIVGGRVGAQLLTSIDLKTEDVPWRLDPAVARDQPLSGDESVGGTSVVLLFVLGLDVAPNAGEASARPHQATPAP